MPDIDAVLLTDGDTEAERVNDTDTLIELDRDAVALADEEGEMSAAIDAACAVVAATTLVEVFVQLRVP